MKSTLRLEGREGEMILTPQLSKDTHTHVKDLSRIVKKHAEDIEEDLYLTTSIIQQGVKFTWGPVSELDLDEMEKVETDELI